jgi:glutaredoxin 2
MTEKVSKDLLDLDELMNDPVKAIEEGRKSGKIKSVDFIDKSGDNIENISDTLNKIEEIIKGHNGCGLSLKTKDIIKGYNKGIIAGEKVAPLMTDSDTDKVRNFFKSAEKANKSVVVTPLTSTVKDISRSLCDYTITNDFEMMFPSEKDKSSIEKCKCRMVMKQFIMDSFLYHENILTPQATLANMFSGVEPEPVNSITLSRIPSYEITLNKYLESIKNRSDNNTIIENLELKRTLNKFKSGVATAIKKVEIYAEGKKEPIMSQVAYIMYTYSQNRKGKEMNAK